MAPELGLIEGFFGKPWSWEARAETVRFLQPHGYSFYHYAPKADAYLRRQWQQPHPDAEAEAIAALAATCRQTGVRFGIGLSPFELYLQDDGDWQRALEAKVRLLDAFRPDDLAILFDDMRGDVPDLAERQAAILDIAGAATSATRVFCCPSYYSDEPILDIAFGERPPNYLRDLGARLDPAVQIFWTGPEVASREFTPGHLARVTDELGRKPFLWDNYPVNDGSRMSQHLHLRGFTGRPGGIADFIAGHAINPASQPVLSRIPLLTLIESYAERDRYDYAAAFLRAAEKVAGPDLGYRLHCDLLTLHDRGLDRLGDRHAILRDRYTAYDHPAAAEVVAWLDGAWAISDDEVHTQ